jgi:FKBP-type peptidyl-prolyl cis-trans isomerase
MEVKHEVRGRRQFFIAALVFVVVAVSWAIIPYVHPQTRTAAKTQPKSSKQSTPDKTDVQPVLNTQKDKINYAIGVSLLSNFKKQGIDIDLDLVIRGMKDAFSGDKLLMTDEELRQTMMIYQAQVRQIQGKARAELAETNKKEGEAFLEENKKQEGVVTLPSGLQYKIIKAGDGRTPTDTDTVECRYRGTVINGTEFDSSYRTGRPSTFKVNGVIPGWTEALKLMPVGSTWKLFIPPQLAYGERGAGGPIGPNATLIFEVELLAIK